MSHSTIATAGRGMKSKQVSKKIVGDDVIDGFKIRY